MTAVFDIIVIGGGSAGCAMAGRLAETGKYSVLLLEAGVSDRHYRSRVPALTSALVQNPDFDWCYQTEPDASTGGRVDVWPGGKMLGGGSAINGMLYIRAHPYDYDRWAELGADGWDYRSVLPYFRRMEDNERGGDAWRGNGGPVAVSENRARYPITDDWIEAAGQAGIPRSRDLNGEVAEGADHIQVSQKNGQRWSSAAAYIHKRSYDGNLEVWLETPVSKILFDGRKATGVCCVRDGRTETVTARKGVVLSSGSMNSPRLLMLSGVGPAQHLQDIGVPLVHDLPGVGGNLQDHVGTHLVNEVNAATLNRDAKGLRAAYQMAKYALTRQGILTTAIGHAQAFVHGRPGLPAPNLQLSFAAFAFDLDDRGRLVLRPNPSVSTLVALMRVKHHGSIRLRSADPSAAPVINYQKLGSDDDVDQIVEGFHIARKIMQQSAIAPHVVGEVRPGAPFGSDDELRQYIRLAAIPLYHPVGTCKMGKDAQAVVSPDLKVHGMENLWVADASVMPTLPAGNTNATSIMIGDKGADHVLKAL